MTGFLVDKITYMDKKLANQYAKINQNVEGDIVTDTKYNFLADIYILVDPCSQS